MVNIWFGQFATMWYKSFHNVSLNRPELAILSWNIFIAPSPADTIRFHTTETPERVVNGNTRTGCQCSECASTDNILVLSCDMFM